MKCDGIVSDVFYSEDGWCYDSGWGEEEILTHQSCQGPGLGPPAGADTGPLPHGHQQQMRVRWRKIQFRLEVNLAIWASWCEDGWDKAMVFVEILNRVVNDQNFKTPCDQKREREGGWYLPESDVSCLVRTDTFLVLSTKNFIHQPWLNQKENAAKTRCQK